MYNPAERPSTPAASPHADPPALRQRQHSSPVYTSSRGSVHTAAVPTSAGGTARLTGTPLWTRPSLTSPTQNLFSDGFASIAAPLLLSRSIRETTLHRVEGGLSRNASNYATSGDDTDDGHGVASPVELPELLARDGIAAGHHHGSSGRASSHNGTTSGTPYPRITSPSSPAPCSSGEAAATVMNFESLWNNIDRYLFAVYTTLQTGDESSLRPLRTPRHRMGWYTVIYNACSGDPAKSRELYARLALLLLHLLESHVLFPILQNVDHSRIQFLTGSEESPTGAEDTTNASLRLSGSGSASVGSGSLQQQQQQPNTNGSSGSFSGWGRLRSIASGGTGNGGGSASSTSGQARAARSKDISRNSSFQGSVSGGHANSNNNNNNHGSNGQHTNTSNSSFGFMRRLFQSSHRATSPVVGGGSGSHNDDLRGDEGGVGDLGRQSSNSPGLPLTPASAGAMNCNNSNNNSKSAQPPRSRAGWSSTSAPSTPLQLPSRSNSDGAGAFAVPPSRAVVSASSELRSAFEGFDSTVRRDRLSRSPTPQLPTPPPAPQPQSHSPQSALRGGLTINTRLHPATPSTPLPTAGQTASSLLSRQSTVRTVTHTASGGDSTSSSDSELPSTRSPPMDPATAPPSAISVGHGAVAPTLPPSQRQQAQQQQPHSHHLHARVASKTGRVLVNDEEEVLCEANTVASGKRHSRRSRRQHRPSPSTTTTTITTAATTTPAPSKASADVSTRTHLSDDFDDGGSLHTMNSSLSSPHLSHDEGDAEAGEAGAASSGRTGGSGTMIRRDRRRPTCAAHRGSTTDRNLDSQHHHHHANNSSHGPSHHASTYPDDETEDSTAVPSANFVSPSTASLASAADLESPLLSMEPSSSLYGPAVELDDTAATSATVGPASPPQPAASSTTAGSASATPTITVKAAAAVGAAVASSSPARFLPRVLDGAETTEAVPGRGVDSPSAATTPNSTSSFTRQSTQASMSRQASSSGPGSCYTGKETAVPMSPSTLTRDLTSPQDSPLFDTQSHHHHHGHPAQQHCTGDTTAAASDHAAGSNVHGGRRFSLCYTFIQEWQTFLIFRSVVLSCFRYLDQYYTRRYGMDTITLMCFKVFYVTVYEPLHPLLVLELRYLTRYVREVFETTGQIAWEQVELIQATYNIMAELLVLVQSTSSYMVAQQQQQQQQQLQKAGGVTVTNTTSSAAAAAALSQATPYPSAEPQRSRTSSRSRGLSGRGAGTGAVESGASSVASTPRMGSLDTANTAALANTGVSSTNNSHNNTNGNTGSAAERSAASPPVSRRHRLLSLFSGKRHSTPAAMTATEHGSGTPAPAQDDASRAGLRSRSRGDSTESGSRPSAFTNRRPSPGREARGAELDAATAASSALQRHPSEGHTGMSVGDDALFVDDADAAAAASASAAAAAASASASALSLTGSPVLPLVIVVDLRGTVELRDRLEGHTTAHHLTTQALKQWEGMAADRRLRNGTIVKETAKPLAAIVMEDLGNDYVAGIYSFYRNASQAHRDTEEGRRSYVEWALGVKELETHVWRRVRLPFLHAAIHAALNEVLVVEQHRNILLDRQFGLRALLDEWAAAMQRDDLALAPQVQGVLPSSAQHLYGHASPLSAASRTASLSLTKASSEFVEAPIKVGGPQSSEQHFISSFPRPPSSTCLSYDQLTHQSSSQLPLSTVWGDETMTATTATAGTTQQRESSWRWERASGASVVMNSAAAAANAASAALSALSRGSSERFVERVGAWVGTGEGHEHEDTSSAAAAATSTLATSGTATDKAAARSTTPAVPAASPPHHEDPVRQNTTSTVGDIVRTASELGKPGSASMTSSASRSGLLSQSSMEVWKQQSGTADAEAAMAAIAASIAATPAPPPALDALQALYNLFRDVTEDECFVLMAAVLITKFIRDAADLFEAYVRQVSATPEDATAGGSGGGGGAGGSTSASARSPNSVMSGSAAGAAAVAAAANAGVNLMTALVDLIDRYTDLVETVFHNQPILHSALSDAMEEIMCPSRWTKKGSMQAAQQRAQEMLMAAAAAAAASPSDDGSGTASKSDLPSVLLSRDARHATLPLVSLATQHPQAAQQLKLSVLLARYADAFLQQERVGGRLVSGDVFRRLRLIGRLVSLLEDKDTFLEHYRLCLARRLLGTSNAAASPSRETQEPTSTSGMLNLEAERQLVSCLQSYLGATGTHAFEAMLRDYEGTQRTRELFEQEPDFTRLVAKIRVQLITSAQWPMYTMLPITPHSSLQRGMDAFRGYYARQHPSRTLLWVFSLGTATLHGEFAAGAKQIVASTLLATLLLIVSDAHNAGGDKAGTITGAQIAQRVGMPFHLLRTHLHLLSQHRAFNLLRWTPAAPLSASAAATSAAPSAAAMTELDAFALNPAYTHKLRKIRLPLPKTRLTGLPSSEAAAAEQQQQSQPQPSSGVKNGAEDGAGGTRGVVSAAAPESEDAVVTRHVNASRRLLLDTALVRVFKSRRMVMFEDLFQAVTTQLSRQFVPTRRDVKAQLEGLIDRDYVKRSPEDPNAFVYVS